MSDSMDSGNSAAVGELVAMEAACHQSGVVVTESGAGASP
jgi:hypothetical protein